MSVAEAEAALAALDPRFADIIAARGPCTLKPRGRGLPHFETLARSIAYQQLTGKAAETIWRRVRALVDGPFTPEAVLELSIEQLRGAGLSGSKAVSINDLAAKVAIGEVPLRRVGSMSDDDVVEHLSRVRGIGRWTAEMFLMFQLGRLDVWPTGDLGVRKGYAVLHGLPDMPAPKELEVLGDRFRPWRSVAAWYCWRAVDTAVPD